MALMQAQAGSRVKTFTIGSQDSQYSEAKEAKAVAQHLGTDHTELYVSPGDALAIIPRMPEIYDEPFADSSQIPTFLVSQLARRSVTVALSGDGGDEVFGGYNRYLWGRAIWRHTAWMPQRVRAATATAITCVSPERWDRVFGAVASLLPERFRQRGSGREIAQDRGLPCEGESGGGVSHASLRLERQLVSGLEGERTSDGLELASPLGVVSQIPASS